MPHPSQPTTLRLTLEVTCALNGASLQAITDNLQRLAQHGLAEGWITGRTDAEVLSHTVSTVAPPADDASSAADEIADRAQQRTEGGYDAIDLFLIAYAKGEANGGGIDWDDLDVANAKARQERPGHYEAFLSELDDDGDGDEDEDEDEQQS